MVDPPTPQTRPLDNRAAVSFARGGLAAWSRAGLDLFFPPRCLACRAALPHSLPPMFCPACQSQIEPLSSPLCSCCGRPLIGAAGDDHHCGNCLQKPPLFRRARAAVLYDPPVAKAIQACKYQGELTGLATFANLAGRSPARHRADSPQQSG